MKTVMLYCTCMVPLCDIRNVWSSADKFLALESLPAAEEVCPSEIASGRAVGTKCLPTLRFLRPYGTVQRTKVEGMANGQKGTAIRSATPPKPSIYKYTVIYIYIIYTSPSWCFGCKSHKLKSFLKCRVCGLVLVRRSYRLSNAKCCVSVQRDH